MPLHKLSSTNAFVVFDLDDAPATGIVRCAPKILQGGAGDLARSLTYAFATFGIQRGGASAGVNAAPEERTSAVAAFVEEVTPLVADAKLALSAGKGVEAAELTALDEIDGRHEVARSSDGHEDLVTTLSGLGPVVAAGKALGGLDGRDIAIEGFGAGGPALADAAAEAGAKIVAIATSKGMLANPTGLDPAELRASWDNHGEAMVGEDPEPFWKVFGVAADVLLAGSKMGAINHETAGKLSVRAVVPHAPIPFTTRALAVMQRANITALPDFVATAGPIFAWWPTGEADRVSIIAAATDAIGEAIDDTSGHEDGAFLGACYRAEAFLDTWRDELPFGRPLAS